MTDEQLKSLARDADAIARAAMSVLKAHGDSKLPQLGGAIGAVVNSARQLLTDSGMVQALEAPSTDDGGPSAKEILAVAGLIAQAASNRLDERYEEARRNQRQEPDARSVFQFGGGL
ncbi:MAG: hypothetical protein DHS20C14_18590 [Phycisphaeraceae bacterium]|nr:MAG: hypothetical protein DHS20C14_18590 [Phycisphaeraceae bacterium]